MRFLLCPPDYFTVESTINVWMEPEKWKGDDHRSALLQWARLALALAESGHELLEPVPPTEGMPDLCFTANAGVVHRGEVILSQFAHPERQVEEPVYAARFEQLLNEGKIQNIHRLPKGMLFEGAGDCLWDDAGRMFWIGYGFRSDRAAAEYIDRIFNRDVISLKLVDPRFYHLDTCLCPLTRGEIMYFPQAFDQEANSLIESSVMEQYLIVLTEEEATRFCANAICVGDEIFMSWVSPRLSSILTSRGYRLTLTPLTAFHKSGGSARCLALNIP